MQKITFLISGFLVLFLGVFMISFSLQAKEKNPYSLSIIQDKNLIIGNWQREDSAVELHISKLLKNGGLELSYLNSKLIFIEKAGWTDFSGVLRLFVIFRQDDNPGYSLTLNYLAEKDVLIGSLVDGYDKKSYNVTFKRIK